MVSRADSAALPVCVFLVLLSTDFIRNMLAKLDWDALRQAAVALDAGELPDEVWCGSTDCIVLRACRYISPKLPFSYIPYPSVSYIPLNLYFKHTPVNTLPARASLCVRCCNRRFGFTLVPF